MNVISRSRYTIIVLLLLSAVKSTRASDHAITLADSLMAAAFYDHAITEYTRYLFFNPRGASRGSTYSKIGYCYAYLKEWKRAVDAMDKAVLSEENDSAREQRTIERSVILLTSGDRERARESLVEIVGTSHHEETVKRAGMLLFLSHVYAHEWKDAHHTYRSFVKDRFPKPDSVESLLTEALLAQYKSPKTATILSTVIPGGGQMYAGQWLSGLNALLLNASLGFLTVNSYIHEHYVSGFLEFELLFLRYYLGNRLQAYNIAVRQNEKIDHSYEQKIIDLLLKSHPVRGDIQGEGKNGIPEADENVK